MTPDGGHRAHQPPHRAQRRRRARARSRRRRRPAGRARSTSTARCRRGSPRPTSPWRCRRGRAPRRSAASAWRDRPRRSRRARRCCRRWARRGRSTRAAAAGARPRARPRSRSPMWLKPCAVRSRRQRARVAGLLAQVAVGAEEADRDAVEEPRPGGRVRQALEVGERHAVGLGQAPAAGVRAGGGTRQPRAPRPARRSRRQRSGDGRCRAPPRRATQISSEGQRCAHSGVTHS